MGPPPHLILSDFSAEALILQHRSSSSLSSFINSPSEPSPSLPPPRHASISYVDPSVPSASSSSSSLVPEIVTLPENHGLQQRRKARRGGAHKKKHQSDEMSEHSVDGKSEQETSHTSRKALANLERKRKGCHENVCCQCAAGLMADCAAVCCCPFALLHLAALTFVRLPTAVAWKMILRIKNKIHKKRRPPKEGEEESPRSRFPNPWSYGGSPEGTMEPSVRLDSQNLWQHFEGSNLDFGGISMRRDPC